MERGDNIRIISARIATPRDEERMKKKTDGEEGPREEYDFSGGVRGKYAPRR